MLKLVLLLLLRLRLLLLLSAAPLPPPLLLPSSSSSPPGPKPPVGAGRPCRPIVARGEIIGEYRVHNEALVMFLLRHRRAARYGPPAERAAPPEPSEREIIDSINAKLDRARDQMRLREARRVD